MLYSTIKQCGISLRVANKRCKSKATRLISKATRFCAVNHHASRTIHIFLELKRVESALVEVPLERDAPLISCPRTRTLRSIVVPTGLARLTKGDNERVEIESADPQVSPEHAAKRFMCAEQACRYMAVID